MNIAIDLGGTSVRVALVDGSKIVSLISEPCRADRPENEVLDHICSLIDRLFSTEVKAIGSRHSIMEGSPSERSPGRKISRSSLYKQ